jgi:hypothetical protein
MLATLTSSGALPFLEGGDDNPYIALRFEPLEKLLVFHVELKEPLMQLFAEPVSKFDGIDALFGEDFYFYLKGTLRTNFSLEQLLESDNLLETVLKGFFLNLSAEAPNCVLKKFRELVEAGGKTESSFQFLTSVLLKNSFVKLKLKSPSEVDKFYEKIGIKEILTECPNLSDLLEQVSLTPEVQELKFDSASPKHFLYKFLQCLKTHVNSGVLLSLSRWNSTCTAGRPSAASRPAAPRPIRSSTSSSTRSDPMLAPARQEEARF